MHVNNNIVDNSWTKGLQPKNKKSDLSEKPQGKDYKVHAVGRLPTNLQSSGQTHVRWPDPQCNAMPIKLFFMLRGKKILV